MMKVYDTLKKYNMISAADRVLCALSGGMDSVALTHFLATNAKELGITVCAAHFSHGIREYAAESERTLCSELCERLGIELICGEGDTVNYAKDNKLGLEQAARELRYSFLFDSAQKCGASKIATAHHANDNVETVIMNAKRGTAIKGLCGIPPVRDIFIRPLIDTYRSDIEKYIIQNKLMYAVDITNTIPCCQRNEVRLILLPELRRQFSNFDELINRFSNVAKVYNDKIECKAKNIVTYCTVSEKSVSISLDVLLKADKVCAARAFEKMCVMAGSDSMLSGRHIESIHKLCLSKDPSASVDVPGLRISRRYNDLLFAKPVFKADAEDTIIRMDEKVLFGEWEIEIKNGKHPDAYVMDKTMLSFPLNIRKRKEGDRIYINNCTKSIKKIMIDKKIPKEMRDNIPVLLDNNKVIAIGSIGFDKTYCTNDPLNMISIIFRRIEV